MRRLLAIAAVLAAIFLVPTGDAMAQAGGIRFGLDPGAQFPERQFTLTLPRGVEPYQVQVMENGIPVIPHLHPASASRVPLSLALVLDDSDSMQGPQLTAAKDAATELLGARPDRSEAMVIAFAHRPDVVAPWGSSAGASAAAVQALQPSNGTALWDAVVMASQQLSGRPGVTKAIVLLTDGADNSSASSAAEAAAAARQSGVKVFAVALPGVDAAQLATIGRLVSQSGGDLVQVGSVADLSKVYAQFAERLSRQYVLTYHSQLRKAGTNVTVEVTAGSSVATQRYTVPALGAVDAGFSLGKRAWWASTFALTLMALVAGALILVSAYMALRPVPVSPKDRLLKYGSDADTGTADLAELAEQLVKRDAPKRGLAATATWQRFVADIGRGGISRKPVEMVLIGLGLGLLGGLVLAVVTGIPVVVLAGPPAGVFGVVLFVRRRARAWHDHFDESLAEALTVLASSLRAGHSLLQAVAHVAEESNEETRDEWDEVVRQTRLGVSVEDALDEMVERVGSKDMRWIAMVARVQHQVGGNMAEMFDIVAETVRERHQLRAQVHSLTAQGRMTRWILTLAPLAIGGLLFVTQPRYLINFLTDPIGEVLVAAALVLMLIGTLWLKRIVEVDVT